MTANCLAGSAASARVSMVSTSCASCQVGGRRAEASTMERRTCSRYAALAVTSRCALMTWEPVAAAAHPPKKPPAMALSGTPSHRARA